MNASGLSSSLLYLKNSLAAGFAPILSVAVPAITALIDAIAQALAWIGQLVAALTGKSTFVKAKKTQEDYAKSLKKTGSAAKDAKNSLAAFDKLNVLSQNNAGGGGGGSGTDPSQMFETVAVSSSLSKALDALKKKWSDLSNLFAKGFKVGLGDTTSRFATIQKGLQSIKESLADIFSDPRVQAAASTWGNKMVYDLGVIAGSVASVGITLAANLVGGTAKYLEEARERIKQYIIDMFDITGDIADIVANFSAAFAEVFSVFADENGQTFTANLIGFFSNSFMGFTEVFAKLGRDLLNALLTPLTNNTAGFKQAFDGLLGVAAQIMGDLKDLFTDAFDQINQTYDEHVAPMFDAFTEGLTEIHKSALEAFETYILPALQKVADKFTEVKSQYLQPFIKSFVELFGNVADTLTVLWNQVLQPLLNWIVQSFAPLIGAAIENVGGFFTALLAVVSTAAQQSLSEAKTDGVAAIGTAKTEGLQAIDKAKSDIETARSGAIKDIDTAKTSGVQAVEAVTAGIEQTKTSALEEIDGSKTAAVQAVETAKTEGVAAVNAAVEAGKINFVTDESLTLSGRAADAKVVGDELAKKADQTDLEYLRKRQNILVGSETGSRVCVTDAFEAPLEGLVLYGKSTQVTTTGAQLLNIPDAERTIRGVTLRIQNGVIEMNGTATEGGYAYVDIAKTPLTGVYTLSIDGAVKGALLDDKFQRLIESTASLNGKTARMLTFYITKDVKYSLTGIKVMLNAGDTALPWEPYTGGKPSPSPDYPQEIQSAKSEVVVHGKNLFGGRFYYANYSNEVLRIDETRNENEVKLPFAPTYETFGVCKVIKCQKGKTYVISVTNPNKNAAIGMAEYENIEKALNFNNALGFIRMNDKILEKSYTAKSDGILVCGIAGSWTNGTTTLHECTESELLQVEEASEATDYEPYRTPQTITITSPTSLPGIPVSSDGNYTDDTGQQWICDEVDLERGVYVQRVYSIIVDGEDVTFSQAGRYCNMNLKKLPSAKSIIGTSQRIEARSTFTSETWNFNPEMGFLYLIKENYAETINESCKEHSGEVMYALAAPIEIPLSAADIAAYRALITYGPTTIVETDGAGIKLDYQRDVNIVIKQLTDTIASMTN